MSYTEQMTQALAISDVFNSATTSNNTVTSAAYVDMTKSRRALYLVYITSVASGQINFTLQSSAQTNFNVAHNIATTLTSNFNASNNSQWVTLEVRADQVTQLNSGDRYVRLSATTNGNTTFIAVGLGGEGVQKPNSQNTLNTSYVTQQVVSST